MTEAEEARLHKYVDRVSSGEELSAPERRDFDRLCNIWDREHSEAREHPYFT
jgi:hypothetical protein